MGGGGAGAGVGIQQVVVEAHLFGSQKINKKADIWCHFPEERGQCKK